MTLQIWTSHATDTATCLLWDDLLVILFNNTRKHHSTRIFAPANRKTTRDYALHVYPS